MREGQATARFSSLIRVGLPDRRLSRGSSWSYFERAIIYYYPPRSSQTSLVWIITFFPATILSLPLSRLFLLRMLKLQSSLVTMMLMATMLSCLAAVVEAQQTADDRLLAACMSPRGQDNAEEVVAALNEGANINAQGPRSGQTCFMGAALRGKPNIVRKLLELGADPNIPEANGYTPPHGAGFQGRLEIMKILKEEVKMDVVNAPHEDGFFPIHRACWGKEERHAQVVEYLLEIGEDVNRVAKERGTCYDMTTNPHTIKVLEKYGGKKSIPDEAEL